MLDPVGLGLGGLVIWNEWLGHLLSGRLDVQAGWSTMIF